MRTLVLYDIVNDRIRLKVAETCLDYGLDREQFSAFLGDLTRSQQRELMRRLAALLGDTPGAILLVPISRDDWEARIHVMNARDTEDEAETTREPDDYPF